ncbi:MAG: hypothetical protein RL630_269 [Verrucomicrobiota bacterium]|jgi:hypothetical protein
MESETFPNEPAPVRRKPRARSRKTSTDLEKAAPDPFVEEAEPAVQFEEIQELPSEQAEPRESRVGIISDFAPLVIAVAFVLFLFSQGLGLRQAEAALRWQNQNLARQLETLQTARANTSKLILERQSVVDQSQRVSTGYNELLVGLIKLAETDQDARSVVEKFNIKPAGASEPPAPKDGKK